MGVQPESAIRTWIDRLLPTPAETLAAEAAQLERSDAQAAEEKYSAALSLDPDLVAAQIGLARIALEQGRLEEAQARILEPGAARVSRARGREDQGRAEAPPSGWRRSAALRPHVRRWLANRMTQN